MKRGRERRDPLPERALLFRHLITIQASSSTQYGTRGQNNIYSKDESLSPAKRTGKEGRSLVADNLGEVAVATTTGDGSNSSEVVRRKRDVDRIFENALGCSRLGEHREPTLCSPGPISA
jgi:hypothetical protein